jgi:hypothetical protein
MAQDCDIKISFAVTGLDFQALREMANRLVHKEASKTAIVMHPRAYFLACLALLAQAVRLVRSMRPRTLYALRRMPAQHSTPSKGFDVLAAHRETIDKVLRRAPGSAVALYGHRRRKDRYLGRTDMFWCCRGLGFHVTGTGQVYCPCEAGKLRESLDKEVT